MQTIRENMKYLRYAVILLFVCLMGYWAASIYNNYIDTAKIIDVTELMIVDPPGAGDLSNKSAGPPPPPIATTEAPMNKVKVLGVIEVELSQANTWTSVLQILAVILGSVFGIKIINTTFKKIENL